MEKKYFDRIDEIAELENAFSDVDSELVFPPTKESVESLRIVLNLMDELDMLDGVTPEKIYPDDDNGVIIEYLIKDSDCSDRGSDDYVDYVVEINVKDNFAILSNNIEYVYNSGDIRIVPLSGKHYSAVKAAYKIGGYIEYAKERLDGRDTECGIQARWCSIKFDVYDCGIRFICNDIGKDIFIDAGDVERLLDELNLACDLCDPDARFSLTEEGKKLLKELSDEQKGKKE